MAKFTEGPWVAKFEHTDDGDEYIRIELPDDGFFGEEYMCISGIGSHTNGRLIAAAPDMYEALQAAERILYRSPDVTTNCNGTAPTTTTRGTLSQIRALLSRIDGETL